MQVGKEMQARANAVQTEHMIPRKPASRKNEVNTSARSLGDDRDRPASRIWQSRGQTQMTGDSRNDANGKGIAKIFSQNL